MADVWVRGTTDARVSGIEIYTAYKLCDTQCGLEATGRSRVPDLWQPPGHKTFLDIPRSPLAAEFYAVIRGILAAQEASYAGVVIHLAKGWIADMIQHPVRLSDETCHLMRDHILDLGKEITLAFVVETPSQIKVILRD